MDKTMMQFKIEAGKRKAKEAFGKAVELAKSGIEYAKENKEIVVPLVVAGATVSKKALNNRKQHDEEVDKLTRFYDNRMGRYTRVKRIPKSYEEAEIERRYRNGESYREILTDMGLAK